MNSVACCSHVSFILSQKKNSPKESTVNITQFSAIHTTYIYIYSAVLHSAEVGRYF